MNTALIFAGGTGKRMGSAGRPKQFLELTASPSSSTPWSILTAIPKSMPSPWSASQTGSTI